MTTLHRHLGLVSLTFYGVGLILGAGIYSILGEATSIAGSSVWLSFLIGSLAALFTGLSYAELATMYPRAGAEYVYLHSAWPKQRWLPGTIGWVLVASGLATSATVALAFAGYASAYIDVPRWVIAIVVIGLAALVNAIGARESSRLNIVFTVIEASGLIALIIVGMRDPDVADVIAGTQFSGVLAGAGLVFFAFLGFEHVANLAEEARDPGRDLPRAIITAVAVTTILYVLVAISSVALLDVDRLATSESSLADAMRAGAPRLAGALGGVALFATANTVLIAMMAGSRLLYSLARGGDAPPVLGRIDGPGRTPVLAIAMAATAALCFLPLGSVGRIGSVASMMALLAFVLVNAALIVLRRTKPGVARPFRIPGEYRGIALVAAFGLASSLVLITQFDAIVYLIGGISIAVGFAIQAVPWTRAGGLPPNPD